MRIRDGDVNVYVFGRDEDEADYTYLHSVVTDNHGRYKTEPVREKKSTEGDGERYYKVNYEINWDIIDSLPVLHVVNRSYTRQWIEKPFLRKLDHYLLNYHGMIAHDCEDDIDQVYGDRGKFNENGPIEIIASSKGPSVIMKETGEVSVYYNKGSKLYRRRGLKLNSEWEDEEELFTAPCQTTYYYNGIIYVFHIIDNTLKLRRSFNGGSIFKSELITIADNIPNQYVACIKPDSGELVVVFTKDDALYKKVSYDCGDTWSQDEQQLISDGKIQSVFYFNGIAYAFYFKNSDIVLKRSYDMLKSVENGLIEVVKSPLTQYITCINREDGQLRLAYIDNTNRVKEVISNDCGESWEVD